MRDAAGNGRLPTRLDNRGTARIPNVARHSALSGHEEQCSTSLFVYPPVHWTLSAPSSNQQARLRGVASARCSAPIPPCIYDLLMVARRLHTATLVELVEGLSDRRLVRDGKHAHPSAEKTKCVDAVERGLRSGRNLHDSQCFSLCRSRLANGRAEDGRSALA